MTGFQNKLKYVSDKFEAENGRLPTVEELGQLYSKEMSDLQKKSRENYSGDGGFRSLSKEKLQEISKKGVEARGKKTRGSAA